ncbi:hypothetical protein HYDPIDRAFT_165832 [Hydnomerulius pinastri MD-312]|nr:hypothetical protein HYDPIDRAFT_165832 [Hydnomerulius pinastri MD-312]
MHSISIQARLKRLIDIQTVTKIGNTTKDSRRTYSTLSPGGTSNVPQQTDLLERYRGLVALGKIRYDEEQVRVVMRLRNLQRQLDGYAPPALTSGLLSQQRTNTSPPVDEDITPWWLSSERVAAESLPPIRVKSLTEELANLDTPKGLLLTGPPGSGKSFLVDLWFSALPTPYKTRKHYNELVLELYRAVWEETRQRMALVHTAEPSEPQISSPAWNRSIRNQWRNLAKLDLLPRRWRRTPQDRFTAPMRSDGQPTIAFVIAQRLIGRHWLLVFDEVQLLDVSSAGLLADVLTWYWKMGGVVVGTSNKVPDDLYKNGVSRDRLEPFVEALKARCPVVSIPETQDWRRIKALDTDGRTWFVWGQEAALDELLASSTVRDAVSRSTPHHAVPHSTDTPISESISVFGRSLNVSWSLNGACKFKFAQLCNENTWKSLGPADYLTLASTYHTVVITDIPVLKLSAKNQARRFISLIDALYEARCRLICHAESDAENLFFPDAAQETGAQPEINHDVMHVETIAEMQDVYRPNVSSYDAPAMPEAPSQQNVLSLDKLTIFSGQEEQFAFKRALSRLIEMTSMKYTLEEHWNPLPLASRKWERKPELPTLLANVERPAIPPKISSDAYETADFANEAAYEDSERSPTRPEAPRLSSDHVWGVREDWGEKAKEWGKGAKQGKDKARHKQHAMATNPSETTPATSAPPNPANIITALGNAFKSQNGEPITGERIAQLLAQNMGQLGELARQGKLNAQQIQQLKEYAERYKTPGATGAPGTSATTPTSATAPKPATTPATAAASNGTTSAFKSGSPAPVLTSTPGDGYPISTTLNTTNPGPVQWAATQQARPTLTGGMSSGRVSGTPAQIARSDEATSLTLEDGRSRRKNTPGDQSMRRSIQDLVSSVDPNVRIEPEVEDLLLQIADEFIDSVTNFGCRLAKHRGGDTLEVKDLQLHLERNHNIRIPGFASDETRISLSQSSVAPAVPAPTTKKSAQGTSVTLRSQRLAQVQQAKREGKLI